MKKRLRSRVLAVGMVGSSLLAAGMVLYAQDKPAASQLLERGSKLYDQKQYEEAKKVLLDINPDQLPEDQRVKRDDLLKQTDLALAKAAPSNETFDNAKAAQEAGQLAQAAKLYEIVTQSPNAAPEIKQNAKVQLALVRESQKQKAPAMKALLKDAIAAYEGGRLEEAQNALYTIETVGTETLDWQDASKPAKYQRLIAEKRLALAAASATPATAPAIAAAHAAVAAPAPAAVPAPAAAPATPAPAAADTAAAAPVGPTMLAPAAAPATPIAVPADVAATATAPATDTDLLTQTIDTQELQRQRAVTRYEASKAASQQALAAKNYTRALEQAQEARALVEANQAYFSTPEYNDRIADANQLVSTAQAAAAEATRTAEAAASANARRAEAELANRRSQQRHEEINRLMEQAMAAADRQQYAEAISLLDNVLAIDPQNNSAKFLRRTMQDKDAFGNWKKLDRLQSDEWVKQMQENKETMIPYSQLMIYPEDWPQLSRRRQGDQAASESDANRRTRERLDAEIDQLSADQMSFDRVIRYLADKMNVNISVNWKALEGIPVDRNTQVSVNLHNVPFRKALSTVLAEAGGQTGNLGYTIDEGVITISTREELNSAKYQVIRVYDIRDLLVQPDNTVQPPTFNLEAISSNSTTTGGSGSSGTSSGNIFNETGGQSTGGTTKNRDDIVKEIIGTIQATVAPDTWRDNSGNIGSMRELNGQLIVNQTVDNQVQVYNLLQQLRETRALQIAIEARMLLVSNNFLDDFGFGWDLTLPAGALGNNVGTVGIANNTAALATPPSTGIPGALGGGALTSNSLDITGQILDNWQLNLLLRATQADKRTTTVTAPRVTLFNGQRGYLAVTSQQNFIANFNQQASGGGINSSAAVATTFDVRTLTTGVVLFVEATVSADRRYVVMKLQPSLSSLDGIDTFSVGTTTTSGGTNTGGNSGNTGGSTGSTSNSSSSDSSNNGSAIVSTGGAFVQLPRITYTTVNTMVSVPDGGTLLIGGQKLVGESEIEIGVPVLSKIPGLNRLFTNRSYTKDERTLLILVRPKIIIQREEEYKAFGMNFDTAPASSAPTMMPGVPAAANGAAAQ